MPQLIKYLVCGGRNYTDRVFVFKTLDSLPRPNLVIEGGQRKWDPVLKHIVGGADYLGKEWADARGIECVTENAEWRRLGRAAGRARNALMLEKYKPTLVVAFKGGRGTANMMRLAREAGVEVLKAWEIKEKKSDQSASIF